MSIPLSWQHEYFGINTHLEALFTRAATQRMQCTFHMAYEQYAQKCFLYAQRVRKKKEEKSRNYIAYVLPLSNQSHD